MRIERESKQYIETPSNLTNHDHFIKPILKKESNMYRNISNPNIDLKKEMEFPFLAGEENDDA